jgi:hypothetical protein
MIEQLATKIAKAWAERSDDEQIKSLKPGAPDWGSFFDQIFSFIEKLLPLLDMCPMDPKRVRTTAAKWAPCAEMSFRQKRRKLGFIGAWRLSSWQDDFDAALGRRVSEGIDNEEFQSVCLQVAATSTDEEQAEIHAAAGRARERAA